MRTPALIRLALRAIHLLPQAGEVKNSSPLPLAGEVANFARQSWGVRAFLLFTMLLSVPAHAVNPDEILKDPGLEARARSISAGLRCLVCQNQSIDDSDATVARDLRILIREQLQNKKSDDEVVDFVVARYGEYVLLKPRLKPTTLILWFSPFAVLFAGLTFAFRRRSMTSEAKLTPTEETEVAAILRK
jgi:cytochrome c-type biogenesis protein CcmH